MKKHLPGIEVEQAIALLEQAVSPVVDTEECDLLEVRDRVLAQDVYSSIAVPRFARSAMDGYAVHSDDTLGASPGTPICLQVLSEVMAGDAPSATVASSTAVRIMTGAPIPPGYDSVLRQEDSDYGEETVFVYRTVAAGENYCPPAEDLAEGTLAVAAHSRLTPHHIGILASIGLSRVPVLRRLRVGILATGTELAAPGTKLEPAQIYATSGYVIASHLLAAGVEVSFVDICPDKADSFCRTMRLHMPKVDILLTTGGVSVGKKDFLEEALRLLGARILFHGVRMKPGTPVMAALFEGKPVLCMSGNPFAALVNFQVLFWPMLAKAMHAPCLSWHRRRAVLCAGSMKPSTLRRFLRAYCNERGVHLYTGNHRSSVLSNLTESNCIIDQPPGKALHVGDSVDILYWSCFL